MSRHLGFQGCYVSPEGFRDLRKSADLICKQVADPVDFAIRTIQNWEMGGTRITWMAYRMLHNLTGHALPSKASDGWAIHGNRL